MVFQWSLRQEREEDPDQEQQHTFLSEITFHEATTGRNANEWKDATVTEMTSILKNDTWDLGDPCDDAKVVGCSMVLRDKLKPDGTLERRKARLVAEGFKHERCMNDAGLDRVKIM